MVDVLLGVSHGVANRFVEAQTALLAELSLAVDVGIGPVGHFERGGQPFADATHLCGDSAVGLVYRALDVGVELVVELIVELKALEPGMLAAVIRVTLASDVRFGDADRRVALQLQADILSFFALLLNVFAWEYHHRRVGQLEEQSVVVGHRRGADWHLCSDEENEQG